MSLIGNIIWILTGGFILAGAWLLAGILCCLTIIGIPLGVQCFKFALLALCPFGRQVIYGQFGVVSLFANIIWIVFVGLYLALLAVSAGLIFCMTVIGIPFGLQYFKFARLALLPFGASII